jgi:hypothetical protein
MALPIVEMRVYREAFGNRRAADPVEVLTYVALFETARSGLPKEGFHCVIFRPKANGPYRDGIEINGLWIEDLDGDDLFCIELWSDLTGMLMSDFEAKAKQFNRRFDPKRPDAGQIVI